MITLRELFQVTWDITLVKIWAYTPDGEKLKDGMRLIHKWIYGDDIQESVHQRYDREDGKLSIIEGRINHHGEPTRGGAEIGWGVKEKIFPKGLIDAQITHLSMHSRYKGNGCEVFVYIELPELEAISMIPEESYSYLDKKK